MHVIHMFSCICLLSAHMITSNYNHFCGMVFVGVVLYCLQGHICDEYVCLPSLVSSIHDVFAVTFLVLHIHSGCPLLTIFTNNGANSAYVWHFKHLNYQCYCNR